MDKRKQETFNEMRSILTENWLFSMLVYFFYYIRMPCAFPFPWHIQKEMVQLVHPRLTIVHTENPIEYLNYENWYLQLLKDEVGRFFNCPTVFIGPLTEKIFRPFLVLPFSSGLMRTVNFWGRLFLTERIQSKRVKAKLDIHLGTDGISWVLRPLRVRHPSATAPSTPSRMKPNSRKRWKPSAIHGPQPFPAL